MSKKRIMLCLSFSLLLMGFFISDVYAGSIEDFRVDKDKLIEYIGTDAEVSIPTFITEVGSEAFADSKTLQKVNFHNKVTEIDFGAFENCTKLKELELPNSVEIIGASAFSGCTDLDTVYMGREVRIIGAGAFASCTSLDEINIHNQNSYFSHSDGILYNKDKTKIYQALAGNKEKKYEMPKSVVEILEFAFWDCDNLETIYLSNELKIIPESAFANCTGLNTINIPYSVTEIEMLAFDGCESLENIRIPESVKTIHKTAFDGCVNVKIEATEGSKADVFSKDFYKNNQTIRNQSTLSGNHLDGIKLPSDKDKENEENSSKKAVIEIEPMKQGLLHLRKTSIVGNYSFIIMDKSNFKVYNTVKMDTK